MFKAEQCLHNVTRPFTQNRSITCNYILAMGKCLSLQAMIEWRGKGFSRYGASKLLQQTNCDFIGDDTCVSVDLTEFTNDKGETMRFR